MKNLTATTLLLLASGLCAQEIDPAIDPIAAEVFADDLPVPATEVAAETPELPPEPEPKAPSREQTVPVADESADVPVAETVDDPNVVVDYSADTATIALSPDATPAEELAYQYQRYLQLMTDGVYDEADSVAKRVVELALKVSGPKSLDFSKALTNLAIVQHRNEQYDASQQNFQSAIEIIESTEDRLNGALVNPLKGLGTSQLESGRPDLASETFGRAVHVSHVNLGPHNLEQISILESLAETSMRTGAIDDARQYQDMIYALNLREYSSNSMAMIPALMRRAEWQLRAGLIGDYRVTLRRVIQVIEASTSADDVRLVDPLTRLGRSFYYSDVSGSESMAGTAMLSGEIYFKRALRIATEAPEPDWQMIASASLALGDFYMYQGNEQRASSIYKESWDALSDDDDRLEFRAQQLERVVTLQEKQIPNYLNMASAEAAAKKEPAVLQGSITIAYNITSRGRASDLTLVEAQPATFDEMERIVQRELRNRLYRPRFVDGEPVDTDGQLVIHRFFFRQSDLDAVQPQAAATEAEADTT